MKFNNVRTKLTKRLEKVFEIMPVVNKVADIGTDHGYLPAAIIEGNKAKRAIAADINEGPLAAAKKYIVERNLTEVIECRLGNGMQVLKDEDKVDAVSICGMGGFLISQILNESTVRPKFLVLQPQNGKKELKQTLLNLGYVPEDEQLVSDMNHMYEVWRWRLANESEIIQHLYHGINDNDIRWDIGAYICDTKDVLLPTHLEKLIGIEKNILMAMKKTPDNHPQKREHSLLLEKLEACYENYC